MCPASRIPGLHEAGGWAIPDRLNIARQCLSQPSENVAIVDLTDGGREDVTFGQLERMTDGIARVLQQQTKPGDRIGVLLSQSPWCAAAHLAIWKTGAISVPLFKLFKRGCAGVSGR